MPLKLLARTKAQKYGVDPDMFERQIQQESQWNPRAYNADSGASGIAQLMPQFYPNVDPYDPDQALDAAASSVASYRKMYGGDVRKALSAYNYGPGNLNKLVGQYGDAWEQYLPGETKQYLSVIMPGGNAPGGVSMARYGNMAPGYRPIYPLSPGDPDEEEDQDLDIDKLTGKSTGTVTYGPPQKDEYGRTFRMGSNNKPSYDPAPPAPVKPTVTEGGKTQEKIGAFIQTFGRAPTADEQIDLFNDKPIGTTAAERAKGGAPGRATYGPVQYDEYGRPFQRDSDGKVHELTGPPSAPAGRDLRMTEGESARLGFDMAKWQAEQEASGSLSPFQEAQVDRWGREDERQVTLDERQARKDEIDAEVRQANQEYQQATLNYQIAQGEATKAYQQAQLEVDREYKQALVENARATLEESKRQFVITEARLRQAQAEQKRQNRINNMFEASERTGLISTGILNLGNSAPGYGDKIGILSGFQR